MAGSATRSNRLDSAANYATTFESHHRTGAEHSRRNGAGHLSPGPAPSSDWPVGSAPRKSPDHRNARSDRHRRIGSWPMSVVMSAEPVDPTEVELLQQVQQQWNNGNQPGAVELLRPLADSGRPWATALMAWLLMQQGVPGLEGSITYALRAAGLGMPWQAVHTFNNVIGNLPQAPQLADRLTELAAAGLPW